MPPPSATVPVQESEAPTSLDQMLGLAPHAGAPEKGAFPVAAQNEAPRLPATIPAGPGPAGPGPAGLPGTLDPDGILVSAGSKSTRGAHRRRSDAKVGVVASHKGLVAVAVVAVAAAVITSVVAMGSSPSSRRLAVQTTKVTTPTVKNAVTAKHVTSSPTVSVPLHSGSQDPRPLVTIRVGNDKPINVVLDTGSVGLRVFSNMVPTGVGKGINVTGTQDSIEYADGTTLNGPVSYALIHIGKLTTTSVVPFELAQSVACDPNIPVCPANAGGSGLEQFGIDGIMGIGMGGNYQDDPTTNPFLLLPAPYRGGWSISMAGGGSTLPASGALVFGAHDPTNPAAQFSLQQGEGPNDGMPTWDDWISLCWDVGGLSDCDLTVFDSGTSVTILEGSAFADAETDDPGEIALLNSGTSISAAQQVDGNPLWSFSSGSGPLSTVLVEPAGVNIINSGAQAFYSFKVTYDETHGDIYLS
jgi:Protein of unknown function (DUF3443)